MTTPTPSSAKAKSCLIVDDDPVFVAVLEQTLTDRGVEEVASAGDGQTGMAALAGRPSQIDVVVLDLNMPDSDGMGFLTSAAQLGYRGKIYLVSGEHSSILESAVRLARIHGLDCRQALAKPLDFDRLADLIVDTAGEQTPASPADNRAERHTITRAFVDLKVEAYYQPRVDVGTLAIVGAEMLARITSPDGGHVDTQRAIGHAERTGRIGELTWQMIANAIAGAHLIHGRGSQDLKLSFNVNGDLLASPGFADKLIDLVRRAGVDPRMFILEMTETGIPPDEAMALEALGRLRMNGFALALDDFGTGSSNIERLQMFPFTELKIDKEFIANAGRDAFSRECVTASVRLANELALRTVAEGVETEHDLEFIRSFHIDEAQGYLFGRPMRLSDFLELLGRPAQSDPQARLAG